MWTARTISPASSPSPPTPLALGAQGAHGVDGVVLPLLYRTILRNLKPISIFRMRFATGG